jgi:hypothetical protein
MAAFVDYRTRCAAELRGRGLARARLTPAHDQWWSAAKAALSFVGAGLPALD